MAARYGIHGFCYYFYWFNDHTLLETPLQRIRDDTNITLPFSCAGPTRRGRARYGQSKQVLLANEYTQDTMRGFFAGSAALPATPALHSGRQPPPAAGLSARGHTPMRRMGKHVA